MSTTYITRAVEVNRQLQGLNAQLGQRPIGEARRIELNSRYRDLTAQRQELVRQALAQPGVDPELVRWALDLHADTDEAAETRAQICRAATEAYQAAVGVSGD